MFLAVKTSTCLPIAEAVACKSLVKASVLRLFGLSSTAKRAALGSNSCKIPSRLVPSSAFMELIPVKLPPGRLRLANETDFDRVRPDTKDDRNCRRDSFRCECGWCARRGGDHGHSTLHQIAHQFRQPSIIIVCETEFDRHIAAFDEACFVQAFAERRHNTSTQLRHTGIHKSNHRYRGR